MTIATTERRTAVSTTGPVAGQDRDELRRRGRLVLSEQVIEKVAGQATAEVATASGRSGGVLGIGSDADTNARAKVSVDLSADSADLDIAVGIAYPGSLRDAAQQIRDHVTSRVHELTGVTVRRVDIDIAFLTATSDAGQRRVLR